MNDPMDRPIRLPWWQKKHWQQTGVTAGAAIAVLATAFLLLGPAERSVRAAVSGMTIATVEKGTFHDFIPLRATVVPLETVYLDALEGGRIEHLLVEAGDTITKGESLIEFSNTQLELDVLDREGRLIESITQLQAYETQLEQNHIANQKALAQIDYDIIRLQRSLARRKALVDRGAESAELKDNIQDELDRDLKLKPMQEQSNARQEELRLRQLPQIKAQVEKLEQDLKITHNKLDNLTVKAPVSGRLTAMDLQIGQNRNRGERLAQITPNTGSKLSAAIDEYYLNRVQVGQIADVDFTNKSWRLKISRVYPQVKEGTFTIDLAFTDGTPDGLLPGQAINGKLSLSADQPATILAAGAFLERSGGDWVFVLSPDERSAERRRIKLGRRNVEEVEVLADLQPGDKVITSDYSGLERIDRIDLTR